MGTIINISSVAGHIPLPFHAVYSATKFAMNAFGKAARVELKPAGIHVMMVCPGYVRTDFGAVSELLAAGRSARGRSPGAARARALREHARGRRPQPHERCNRFASPRGSGRGGIKS